MGMKPRLLLDFGASDKENIIFLFNKFYNIVNFSKETTNIFIIRNKKKKSVGKYKFVE